MSLAGLIAAAWYRCLLYALCVSSYPATLPPLCLVQRVAADSDSDTVRGLPVSMGPAGAATLGHVVLGLTRRDMTLLLLLLVTSHVYSRPHGILSGDDRYYMNGNIRCLRCPPGNFVEEDCVVPDTRGKCTDCHAGRTYSEHPTGMNHCLRCTRCRDDQEEVSPCAIAKNTVCRCKKGTFCPPDHPCEVCLPCTTSCPPDQVIKSPCNSTSDTECSFPDSSISKKTAIICGVIGTIVFIIIIIIAICFFLLPVLRKDTSTRECKRWSKMLTTSCCCKPGDTAEDVNLLHTDTKLVFRDAKQREQITIKSLDIFVDKVPINMFEKFMRNLELPPNTIEFAKQNHPGNTYEQCYEMLDKWRQEYPYDVNVLLTTLRTLRMGGVADEITEQLIRDGLYVRQTPS
ncbi:tumor necrosis factor receptor superfamily member 10A-like [Pseudophryne corroboree]|uniref:tumor necrosis factor receptor superfamily member 10A-like n=1 Tax=Pseudophryne corroboree TaxID=495146 RepID=UPI0030818F33